MDGSEGEVTSTWHGEKRRVVIESNVTQQFIVMARKHIKVEKSRSKTETMTVHRVSECVELGIRKLYD